ncbi:gamma-glutamylcyclotransferase-like isoform X1 [Cylas formicarius]|uniref:gamma-glutamylcyclotransferase-like isoform X1 n=1 Tax=Cylas formicarius TaxID=197179 RepID=UPI0029585C71|nr:gamma-glutamylcyclotransferase-like isoform X1 [Cylas formicarius]
MVEKFLYFAYGSNLLSHRIHINNPSAVRRGIGKLNDYRLSFVTYSKRWGGCSATIVPKQSSVVWGAVWELDNCHRESLDRQEGVDKNIYIPISVQIELPEGGLTLCRSYRQTADPVDDALENLPLDFRPSEPYLKTIIKGAEESGLPSDYLDFLKTIPHNGYHGPVDVQMPLYYH